MPEETQVVRPLDSAEIKDAIAQRIAEQVRESLNTTCWLYGMAWPKFKARWKIDITLENFGEERETSVDGIIHADLEEGDEVQVEGELPYTPPNVLRKQMGMAIPTVVKRDDGSTEQKAVVFKAKPGPKPRVRADVD
jgi:hypothetical protein